MQRKITATLAAVLMMLSLGPAQADPSGIRYDASTHTYTNIGSSSATRSAAPTPSNPTAPATPKVSRDPDFVEYTIAPSAAAARTVTYPARSAPMQAQGSYVSAGSSGVQVVNPSPSAIVYGSSGYAAFDGGYGYGYGGYGGYGYGYGGYGYGGYGYGYGPCGYGYGYPYGRNNINVNALRPISTTIFVPGQGNVTNTYIPGFGLGGLGLGNVYGFGGGYRPWNRPVNVNRPRVQTR